MVINQTSVSNFSEPLLNFRFAQVFYTPVCTPTRLPGLPTAGADARAPRPSSLGRSAPLNIKGALPKDAFFLFYV